MSEFSTRFWLRPL